MTVTVSDEGPLRIVTIVRPERRNAVDPATAEALHRTFAEFDVDEALRVAILTGADGNFCSGFDLTAVGEVGRIRRPENEGPMGPTRMLLSKPVIAAVEGYAVAGGLELALWCDLRIASASAVFGVFCRRWGVPLIDGGTVRLPRIVGQGRALDMILTGRPVAADEALAMGLANRVVRAGKALDAAREMALQIAAFPQLCMTTDRMSAYRQFDFELTEALRNEGHEGEAPLQAEGLAGAHRFTHGAGRGGRFDESLP